MGPPFFVRTLGYPPFYPHSLFFSNNNNRIQFQSFITFQEFYFKLMTKKIKNLSHHKKTIKFYLVSSKYLIFVLMKIFLSQLDSCYVLQNVYKAIETCMKWDEVIEKLWVMNLSDGADIKILFYDIDLRENKVLSELTLSFYFKSRKECQLWALHVLMCRENEPFLYCRSFSKNNFYWVSAATKKLQHWENLKENYQ